MITTQEKLDAIYVAIEVIGDDNPDAVKALEAMEAELTSKQPDAWTTVDNIRGYLQGDIDVVQVVIRRKAGPGLLVDGYVPVYFGTPPTEES